MRLLYHRHLLAKSPDGFSRGCSGGDDGGDGLDANAAGAPGIIIVAIAIANIPIRLNLLILYIVRYSLSEY